MSFQLPFSCSLGCDLELTLDGTHLMNPKTMEQVLAVTRQQEILEV